MTPAQVRKMLEIITDRRAEEPEWHVAIAALVAWLAKDRLAEIKRAAK